MEKPLADDLMIGSGPIAQFLGIPVRQVFYLAATGQLPLFRMGKKLAGRKSTIARDIAARENAAMSATRVLEHNSAAAAA
jgi:hypothetical protein